MAAEQPYNSGITRLAGATTVACLLPCQYALGDDPSFDVGALSSRINRQLLAPLLEGAWALHHNVQLVDALYIELANQIDAAIITTDSGMSTAAAKAEHVE